ncbi:hypothetical protein AAOP42_13290 [Reichenbachiella sp. MALMAid0571]
MDKEAKKEWRKLKTEKKRNLKLQDRKFEMKFDSIQAAYRQKYLAGKVPQQAIDSSYFRELWSNSGGSIFSSYQQKYLGNDYLSMFFDSTYIENKRGYLKDSLLQIQKSFKQDQIRLLESKYNIPDSMIINTLSPDSIDWGKYKNTYLSNLTDSIAPPTSNSLYIDYLSDVKSLDDSLNHFDYSSAVEMILKEQLQHKLNENILGDLSSNPNGSDDIIASYEEIINADQYKQMMADIPGKKMEFEERIKDSDLLEETLSDHEDHFLGKSKALVVARKELEVIKKKHTLRDYLKYLFDQDMESINENTLVQRFTIAGYIQIGGHKPLLIDYSPSIAYKLTGKASVGFGVNGRAKIGEGSSKEEDLVGYRSFLEYALLKKIYLHGEYERTGVVDKDANADQSARVWSQRWLLGLGKDFKHRSGINGSLLILYNFNRSKTDPHSQTFQVRYGIKI